MKVELASPRGFCAGVDRAVELVERALEKFGPPVHVRHEIVHNRTVVEGLRARGAVFVEELHEVPDGGLVVFSAHGVSKAVRAEAEARGLRVLDATCPLVTKVHLQAVRHRQAGRECVLIGHAGHPEVEGTLGQADGGMHLVQSVEDVAGLEPADPGRLGFVTQTTLSVDDTAAIVAALRARFPAVEGPRQDDICYATQNRQDAVKRLAPRCDVFVVVGSRNSSNSNRLRELAEARGVPAHLVDRVRDLDPTWFEGAERVGVTAGASAPEALVEEIVAAIEGWGGERVPERAPRRERVVFSLPKELRA